MIDLLPNGTVLYQWVIFMITLLTLHFGVFKPTLRLIAERKQRTFGEKNKAETFQHRSQEVVQACQKKIDDARNIGLLKRDDRIQAAETFRDELMKKTRQEIEKKMTKLRQEIDYQTKEVALQLRQYSQDLGREIAGKIMEREV